MKNIARISTIPLVLGLLCGCGTYVPLKDPLHPSDDLVPGTQLTREGAVEQNLVGNIRCEVQNAIYKANTLGSMPYLGTTWGTQITLKLTWDEMSSVAPSVSFIDPRAMMQSFMTSLGVSATAHATRLETITFLWENRELLDAAKKYGLQDCSKRETGTMIESNLRIDEFIYDKASIAKTGVASTIDPALPQFTTLQEDITFVATYGGNVTPTWKLTRISADTSGNLASATRSTTGDILITLGALATDTTGNLLPQLGEPAASQHTAAIIGSSVASQNKSQGQ
jgi:hypothetical protein